MTQLTQHFSHALEKRTALNMAVIHRYVRNPALPSQLFEWDALSVKEYENRAAPIINLFSSRGPTAIARLISEVVVDAFKCVAWRALAEFSKKGQEVQPPNWGHGYASASIVRIGFVTFPLASRNRAHPTRIFRRSTMPVDQGGLSHRLSIQTSATLCRTGTQMVYGDNSRSSAIALTIPSRLWPTLLEPPRSFGNNCQPSKSLSSGINVLWHGAFSYAADASF